jgi:hypothetical protein
MKLNLRVLLFALALGAFALGVAVVATTTASADEAQVVVADAAAQIQLTDDEDPTQPGPSECVQACKQRAQRWVRQCVADGGNPERCQKQGEEKALKCIEQCPRASTDPQPVPSDPDPKQCVGQCERLAHQYYNKCMARTDDAKPAECKRKAERFLRACIERKCPRESTEPDPGNVDPNPEPAPSPEQCQERCSTAAREFLRKCEAGRAGRLAPVDCATRAREMYAKCIENCPPKVEPAPDPDKEACVERCQLLGRQTLRECKDLGAAPERCQQRATLVIRQCIADNCP